MDLRDPGSLKTRDIVRVLALIFGFYILLRLLWVAHPIVFLFFLGVLFGLPLAQGADWLEKRRVPRALGVAIILAAFIGLLTGAGVWMAPILRTQSRELQVRLPEAMDKIDAWLGHRANGVLGMLFNEESTADSARIAASQRVDSAAPAAPSAVVTDSTSDSAAAVVPGAVVRTTTRTHEVEVGGNPRRHRPYPTGDDAPPVAGNAAHRHAGHWYGDDCFPVHHPRQGGVAPRHPRWHLEVHPNRRLDLRRDSGDGDGLHRLATQGAARRDRI